MIFVFVVGGKQAKGELGTVVLSASVVFSFLWLFSLQDGSSRVFIHACKRVHPLAPKLSAEESLLLLSGRLRGANTSAPSSGLDGIIGERVAKFECGFWFIDS